MGDIPETGLDGLTVVVDFSDVSKVFGGRGMEGMAMDCDGSSGTLCMGHNFVCVSLVGGAYHEALPVYASMGSAEFRDVMLRARTGTGGRRRAGIAARCATAPTRGRGTPRRGRGRPRRREPPRRSVFFYVTSPDRELSSPRRTRLVVERAAQTYCDWWAIETFYALK